MASDGVDGRTLGGQDNGGTVGDQDSNEQRTRRGGATVAPPAALHGGFGFWVAL